MSKMHQACCAQMAPGGGLDGNRYRLMEIETRSGRPQPGPCGVPVTGQGRCQAEMSTLNPPPVQCYNTATHHLRIQEGPLGLCQSHYERHVEGEVLWVYLPPL